MTNHIHVLAVPEHPDALSSTFRYTHGRFAQYANTELCRSGHFWQNRFYSCPVEDAATGDVLAYIELNPVRARLVNRPTAFKWSSAGVHLGERQDALGILDLGWWQARWTRPEWASVLEREPLSIEALHRATYSGRPLGSKEFVADLEGRLKRQLERKKAVVPGARTTLPCLGSKP